jgi:glycosidase
LFSFLTQKSSASWEWDEHTQEYYLHLFAPEQPDLNWENDEVRKEVLGMIRWWLEKGVDGFRMDVINFISKTPGLPDGKVTNPNSEFQSGMEHFACGPRLHEWLHDIAAVLKEFDAFSVGEMPGVYDLNEILKAVGWDRNELAMVFQFEMYAPLPILPFIFPLPYTTQLIYYLPPASTLMASTTINSLPAPGLSVSSNVSSQNGSAS